MAVKQRSLMSEAASVALVALESRAPLRDLLDAFERLHVRLVL